LVISLKINVRVNRKDNQEKLATFGTQDEDKHYKQKKSTTKYVLDTIIRKQTQIR